jgi:hypothetical protein
LNNDKSQGYLQYNLVPVPEEVINDQYGGYANYKIDNVCHKPPTKKHFISLNIVRSCQSITLHSQRLPHENFGKQPCRDDY